MACTSLSTASSGSSPRRVTMTAMPAVSDTLALDRCPCCGIATPLLTRRFAIAVRYHYYALYTCSVCPGAILARAQADGGNIEQCWPPTVSVSEHVPARPREYLRQAQESLGQAAGSLMLCASAVDAMLKDKGFKDGSLKARIDKAADQHLITLDMGKWAHQVRLDANDQRHADENADLPTEEEARRSLMFALALAEVLYVLPARVTRGIEESKT